MQIQNFRFYLQDATNFFSVLDYLFTSLEDDQELLPIKKSWLRRILYRFYDPIKVDVNRFLVSKDSFFIRSVVDKELADKKLIEVFDAVVRYYSFQRFVDRFDNLAYKAEKEKNRYVLQAVIEDKLETLAEVTLVKTKSKAVIESVVFDTKTITTLLLGGITHKNETEDEDEPNATPVAPSTVLPLDETVDLSKRYCFDEYMGDDVPARRVIKTGAEIVEEYFPFWSSQMMEKFGTEDQRINFKNCIDDYCVVNWAWEVGPNGDKI